MDLYTLPYAPEPAEAMADPTIGLEDLRKGLCSILIGYLVALATAVAMGALIAYLILKVKAAENSREAWGDASTIMIAGSGAAFLAGLYSVSMIVRGKWLCLMRAPEQCNARWLMFGSILCLFVSPALNFGSYLIGESKAPPARKDQKESGTEWVRRGIDEYKEGLMTRNTRGWIKLCGNGAGLLSSVLFVLFLRALALCWDNVVQARLAELHLMLMGLLAAGAIHLLLYPVKWVAHPQLLVALAGGWLLCVVWYFVLIVIAIAGISHTLEGRTSSAAPR